MTIQLQTGRRFYSIGFDRDIRPVTLLQIHAQGVVLELEDGWQIVSDDLDNLFPNRRAAERAAQRKAL